MPMKRTAIVVIIFIVAFVLYAQAPVFGRPYRFYVIVISVLMAFVASVMLRRRSG